MSRFYYETKQWEQQYLLRTMSVINMGFALAVLAAWPYLGEYIADPVGTTTGETLSGSRIDSVLDYPYVILWAGPVCAVIASYIAHSLRLFTLAKCIAIYPLLLFLLAFAWHNYAAELGWA